MSIFGELGKAIRCITGDYQERLQRMLSLVDLPRINVFRISRAEVMEDPFKIDLCKKFTDFVFSSDYETCGNDFSGEAYIIPSTLREKLERYKAYHLPGGWRLLERIKNAYMASHTGRTGKYDIAPDVDCYDDPESFCWNRLEIKKRIAENYVLPNDWDATRDQVKARDGNRCVLCGVSVSPQKLHVHHIVYRASGGSHHPENLVSLCKYCHATLPKHTHVVEAFRNEIAFSVNMKSKVIHYRHCKRAKGDNIRQISGYDSLIQQGYRPCSNCSCRDASLAWDDKPQNRKIVSHIYTQKPNLILDVLLEGNPLVGILNRSAFQITESRLLIALHLE